VAQYCEDFAVRKQLSVFSLPGDCYQAGPEEKPPIRSYSLQDNQMLFIPLCQRCEGRIEAIGRPRRAADAKDVVVV
jgi:hypothetical protein